LVVFCASFFGKETSLVGGFNTSEKYWSQLGWWNMKFPIYGIQTTNQLLQLKSLLWKPWWPWSIFFDDQKFWNMARKPSASCSITRG
jgi:hypothetical protein